MLFKKQAVHDAWAAAKRTLDFKVVVKGKSYTATDISTLSYDSGAMNGEALTLGSTYTNTIKITFSHLIEDLALLDEITPQIGIQLPDGTWDFTSLGVFIIDAEVQQDRNNNTTTVSASDRMCMMGGTYESKLSYPAAINDVAVEIANMAGMKVNVDDFARLPTEKILSLGKVTYRDAIGYVAQFAGGFATFDRDGLLDIRVLSDPDFTVTPDQYQSKGLTKNEAFYRIGGLTCSVTTTVKDDSGSETQETTTLQAGSTAGTQIILNNPGMTQTLLDGLYEQLQDLNFYPFSLSWFGDPSLEAGDWITVQDTAGNEFKTPNLLYSLTFGGGVTATSKADTTITASANFVYRGATNQIITNIRRYLNAAGHAISEGIDEPTSHKVGDIWFKKEGPDTTIMTYVIDPETGVGSWHEGPSTKANAELQKLFEDLKEEMKGTSATASAAAIAGSAAMVAGNQASAAGSAAQSAADSVAAKVVESSKEVAAAKSAASSAVDQASQAVAAAFDNTQQISTLKTDMAAAVGQASTAFNSANTALANATTALNTAQDAQSTGIQTAKIVDDLNGTVTELTKQTTVIDGQVQTVNTMAQKALDGLTLKSDITTVNILQGTVNSIKGELDVQADKIAATVTASDVTGMLGNYATQSWSEGKISAAKNEITASVQNMTSDMATQTWTQGKLDLTANSFKTQISSVQTNLDNMQVGGTNLIKNTSHITSLDHWQPIGWVADHGVFKLFNHEFYKNGTEALFEEQSTAGLNYSVGSDRFLVKRNTDYIFQIKGFNSGNLNSVTIYFLGRKYGSTNDYDTDAIYTLFSGVNFGSLGLTEKSVVFHVGEHDEGYIRIDHNGTNDGQTGSLFFIEAKMSEGKVLTDYSPAPEDMATVTQFTSIEQTLKGVQITANNAVTQSQYTQLADQFTSTIGQISGVNLIPNSDFSQGNQYWNLSDKARIADKGWKYTDGALVLDPSDTIKDSFIDINVSPNTDYTFSCNMYGTSHVYLVAMKDQTGEWTPVDDVYQDNYHVLTGTDESTPRQSFTLEKTSGQTRRLRLILRADSGTTRSVFTKLQLEEGTSAHTWSPSANGLATFSQFTQLQKDINLRVKTGVLIQQINLSTEGILIDGSKTHITNTTTIDTGVIKSANIQDAAITSAKIGALAVTTANIGYAAVTNTEIAALAVDTAQIADGAITNAKIGNASITTAKIGDAQISSAKIISISADKITAGTIDAANINVIHLNANNITTGTISGANLSINLSTGEILFQKGAIKSTSGNLDIEIDDGTMTVTNSAGNGSRFANGNIYMTSKDWSLWGGKDPDYGSFEYSDGLAGWIGKKGVKISGAEGAQLGTKDFSGMSSMLQPTGAGISTSATVAFMGAEEMIELVAGPSIGLRAPSITIGPRSRIELIGDYVDIPSAYDKTASGSANLIVASDGALVRSTSASKYKTDIHRTMDDEYGQKLLDLPTATWLDKADMKRYSDDPAKQPVPTRNFGMIAEDLAAAGLEYLVVRGQDGQLEGIEYDRIGPALIPVIAKLQKRIEILEQLKGEI